jgi:hypothetical protein
LRLAQGLLKPGMDALYLGLAVGFFALSWALIVACERLS